MPEFWAYILRCADGSYYTSHTDNLEFRLGQHRAGLGSDWTRRRLPVDLVWQESFPTREEAKAAEFQIKPWSRAKKEALIASDWTTLSYFARPPRERPSTSLGTNEREAHEPDPIVSSEVETRNSQRHSTSLGTNA